MYCKFYPYCIHSHHSKVLCKINFEYCEIYNKNIEVNKMAGIKDILGKAFEISKNKEYTVKIFNENDIRSKKIMSLTYLQLGTQLIAEHLIIKEVHIIYNSEYKI